MVIKHDPVDCVEDAPGLPIIVRENILIPVPIKDRACPIQGEVEDLQILRFEMARVDPMGGMRSSQNDHIGVHSRGEHLLILERVMRIELAVHPAIHQDQDEKKDSDKEPSLSQDGSHLRFLSELKIDERMVIILAKKNEK
jgi:hypothetical protein